MTENKQQASNTVICFKKSTQHLTRGDLYLAQARLRYAALHDQEWDVHFYRDEQMDEDVYDTPRTVYFANQNKVGELQACCRICPTDLKRKINRRKVTFLSADCFVKENGKSSFPTGPEYWEASRLCVEGGLRKKAAEPARRKIIAGLLHAVVVYCLANDIRFLYGTMPDKVYRTTWGAAHCEQEWSGPVFENHGAACQTIIKTMTSELAERLREAAGRVEVHDTTKA